MALNPFVVLGASYEADFRDLSKLAKRRQRLLKLGGEAESEAARAITQALDELRDPCRRFQYGLLAFQFTSAEQERVWGDPLLGSVAGAIDSRHTTRLEDLLDPSEAVDPSQLSLPNDPSTANIADYVHLPLQAAARANNIALLQLAQAEADIDRLLDGESVSFNDQADSSDQRRWQTDLRPVHLWQQALGVLAFNFKDPRQQKMRRLFGASLNEPRLTEEAIASMLESRVHEVLHPMQDRVQRAIRKGHGLLAGEILRSIIACNFGVQCNRFFQDLDHWFVTEIQAATQVAVQHIDIAKRLKSDQPLEEFHRSVQKAKDLLGGHITVIANLLAEFQSQFSASCETRMNQLVERVENLVFHAKNNFADVITSNRQNLTFFQGCVKVREKALHLSSDYALKLLIKDNLEKTRKTLRAYEEVTPLHEESGEPEPEPEPQPPLEPRRPVLGPNVRLLGSPDPAHTQKAGCLVPLSFFLSSGILLVMMIVRLI